MEDILIENLKKKIEAHIKNGGSIYDSTKKLPYYQALTYIKNKYKIDSYEEVYRLCGIFFDREYYNYSKLLTKLGESADENNCVDSIQKDRSAGSTILILKNQADELGCSPSDYLILMTNYRLSRNIIKVEYVSNLINEIKAAYGNETDITGIKAKHPNLYQKIRHIAKYTGTPTADVIVMLGFSATAFSTNMVGNYQVNESEIVTQCLHSLDKDGYLVFNEKNSFLYRNIIKCAVNNGQTIEDWTKYHNIKLKQQTLGISRLSRSLVDKQKREQQIASIRSKIIEENGFIVPKDPVRLYHFNIMVSKLIINELMNSQNFSNQDENE